MVDVISTIADFIEIVSAITGDQKSDNPKLDRLDDSIVKSLRDMYFMPEGVVFLLEEIAAGRNPNTDDIEKILPRFNDMEWRVGQALHMLEFDRLTGNREISLRRARILSQLRYGKISLRRSIQEFLNHALTVGNQPLQETAEELIQGIVALNEQIEALEEAHNRRARR
ncbi:MAG: hypothetical protein CGW95_14400 [Phenylobacterium zucineum]|nr:MAG: hypothetical protein CGW95_14400 [Phenylobacterium zucineum]